MQAAVARPVVADNTPGNQRLHDGKGAGLPIFGPIAGERHLRAALRVCNGRCHTKRKTGTALLHQCNEQVG